MKMERNYKGQFKKRTDGILIDGMKSWITSKGYSIIWYKNKNKLVHVYIWEKFNNKSKPDGYELHHIDKNKLNNNINNLQLLKNSVHQKIHKGWVLDKNNNFIAKPCSICKKTLSLDNFYSRGKNYTPSALCKSCHCIKCKEYREKNKEKLKQYNKEWYKKNRK